MKSVKQEISNVSLPTYCLSYTTEYNATINLLNLLFLPPTVPEPDPPS